MNAPKSTHTILTALFALTMLSACAAKKPATGAETAAEDTSASGAAAQAAGGALSSSLSDGTQAQFQFDLKPTLYARLRSEFSLLAKAHAGGLCPTTLSLDNQCSVSGAHMWLTYNDCSFLGRAAWNGTQMLTMSAGSPVCGQFPNPGANQTLYRQFVQGPSQNVPGKLTLNSGGYTGVVDDGVANLANFDSQVIAAIHPNGGYGVAVQFNSSGARSSVSFAHRSQVSGVFDHSVVGSLNVSESSSTSASRVLNGSVKVYHNLMRVVGTSTFTNVTHSNQCCVPVAGEISTSFSAGTNVNPTLVGLQLVGKTEKLTFTGCGSATLTEADGSVKNVTLKRCF